MRRVGLVGEGLSPRGTRRSTEEDSALRLCLIGGLEVREERKSTASGRGARSTSPVAYRVRFTSSRSWSLPGLEAVVVSLGYDFGVAEFEEHGGVAAHLAACR